MASALAEENGRSEEEDDDDELDKQSPAATNPDEGEGTFFATSRVTAYSNSLF